VSRTTRARRAGEIYRDQPLYARMLGLRYVSPSGFLCFVFLEGAVALGFLLALAELVSWWGVLVLPVTVAVMVKLNDVVAGALTKSAPEPLAAGPGGDFGVNDPALRGARTVELRKRGGSVTARGTDRLVDRTVGLRGVAERTVDLRRTNRSEVRARAVDGAAVTRTRTDDLDLREQRARQSAARRYE